MTGRSDEELAALAAAATPGPWKARQEDDDDWAVRQVNDDPPGVTTYIVEGCHQGKSGGMYDAEFIAAAREAVPALLARVAQAETERDAAKELLATVAAYRDQVEPVVARAVRTERALAAVRELCDSYEANCDPTSIQAQVAGIFRAALAGSGVPDTTEDKS